MRTFRPSSPRLSQLVFGAAWALCYACGAGSSEQPEERGLGGSGGSSGSPSNSAGGAPNGGAPATDPTSGGGGTGPTTDASGGGGTGPTTDASGGGGTGPTTDASGGGGTGPMTGPSGGGGSAPVGGDYAGYKVDGRFLLDGCGEKVVLRGVNEMIVWGSKTGQTEFTEIAKTGANSVRIVWTTADGTAAELDVAIQNALAQKMLPVVELHDATGDMSLLPSLVDYWVAPATVAVITKYENQLIVNIGNEVGDDAVTAADFQTAYSTAITRMRDAGIRTPLMIDAPSWGQNIDVLQAAGPALLQHDPLSNLVFSVHMWWHDPSGDRVKSELAESVGLELPLVVGEFAQHAVYMCDQAPFDYKTLLAEAQRLEVGWMAWSWGSVANNDCSDAGSFDMTPDGTFNNLRDWGLEVAVSDPNSIQNTSVKPASLATGSCP